MRAQVHAAVRRNEEALAGLSVACGHQGKASHNMELCIRARKDRVLMNLLTDSQWSDRAQECESRERAAAAFKTARSADKVQRRAIESSWRFAESFIRHRWSQKIGQHLKSGTLCLCLFMVHLVAFVGFLESLQVRRL